MRVYEFPLVPAVLGLILGPLSEQHFRRAMAISENDPSVFLHVHSRRSCSSSLR